MKLKVKTKDCHLIIRIKMSRSEVIDESGLNLFAQLNLRGFLKAKVVKKGVLEYTGPIGISLYERMQKPITKREFLMIIEQIVVTVQKVQFNDLFMDNLLLDIRNVYINEVTKEVQYIYIPTFKPCLRYNICEFVENIMYSVMPESEPDTNYVSEFAYFFRSLKNFDTDRIEQYIAGKDKSVVATIKRQNSGQSGFVTNKPKDHYEHYDNAKGKETKPKREEATGLLQEELTGRLNDATATCAEEEATGLLQEELTDRLEEATGLLMQEPVEETGLLVETECENTMLLYFPTLIRKSTGECISVNKPVFRIGKEKSYVDYSVANNVAVSRSHADIITRGQRYFVIDLNSKNRTYINGEQLPVRCEVEIRNEDILKLANEEFIFQV